MTKMGEMPATGSQKCPVVETGSPGPASKLGEKSGVRVWAVIGVLGIFLSAYCYFSWITSVDFQPVPIQGPDVFEGWRAVALRVFEALSAVVMVVFVGFGIVRPLVKSGRLSLLGKMILGGVVGFVLDAFLNVNQYMFAWNQNNINTGVWSPWLPLHQHDAPGQYAESFLWGLPMYVYFAAFVAFFAFKSASFLHKKFPNLRRSHIYLLLFVEAFLFDLVVENIIIRTTEAYAYPQTIEAVTLFAGSRYQYPLTEAFLVALVGLCFTWLNIQASESPDGRTPVERGLHRVPARWRETVSTLAVIGFCFTVLLCIYHVPYGWLNLHATSFADLPSYMLPAPK